MFRQLFEVVKTVLISSFRKNIILATILIMFPFLLAAWLFELSNPGFQSGFIVDIGGSIMAILSVIIIATLGIEHLYWPKEQSLPWFFLSRLKSRMIYPLGKYVGISIVLGIVLAIFSFVLTLLIYISTGRILLISFLIAFLTWLEYSLFLALFLLFSVVMSKLMSIGLIIPVYFISYSLPFIKSAFPGYHIDLLMSFFPDVSVFNIAIENNSIMFCGLAAVYSFLMIAFYLSLSAVCLRRLDL